MKKSKHFPLNSGRRYFKKALTIILEFANFSAGNERVYQGD
jgi:hypothetical protein